MMCIEDMCQTFFNCSPFYDRMSVEDLEKVSGPKKNLSSCLVQRKPIQSYISVDKKPKRKGGPLQDRKH